MGDLVAAGQTDAHGLLLDVLRIVRRELAVAAAEARVVEPALAGAAILALAEAGVRRQTERAPLPPHICRSEGQLADSMEGISIERTSSGLPAQGKRQLVSSRTVEAEEMLVVVIQHSWSARAEDQRWHPQKDRERCAQYDKPQTVAPLSVQASRQASTVWFAFVICVGSDRWLLTRSE